MGLVDDCSGRSLNQAAVVCGAACLTVSYTLLGWSQLRPAGNRRITAKAHADLSSS
jgi:hypothetical protein